MINSVTEDRRQIDNRAKLLNDTLVRKVYPWVANEYGETEWEELVHSFSLASRQIDDLSGNLRSVYSLQVPTPKKPFPQNQFQIPQILSTMIDKEDREKILTEKASAPEGTVSYDGHNQALDRVLLEYTKSLRNEK